MKAIRKPLEDLLERANLVLIAVGVAIGFATYALAQAVTGAMIMPTVSAVFGISNLEFESFTIRGAEFRYGSLISAAIAFVLVLVAAYFVVYPHRVRRGEEGAADRTRPCPECTSSIPAAAKRCPHCTAIVQPAAA